MLIERDKLSKPACVGYCCCALQSAQRTAWHAHCRAEGPGATRTAAMPLMPTILTTEAVSVSGFIVRFQCNKQLETCFSYANLFFS